ELLKVFPSDIREVDEMFAGKLIGGYAKINDFENMLFWTEYFFKKKPQIQTLKKILEDSHNIFLNLKDVNTLSNGKNFFRRIFDNADNDALIRGAAAKYMMELMLKQEDLDELIKFVDLKYSELKDTVGDERFYYKLRAYIAKNDYENAKSTIKDMEFIPELKDKPEFLELKKRAETLKTTAAIVKSDWEFNSNIENANKLGSGNSDLKLNRLIQNILLSKNSALLETDDKNLLAGAVPKYKESFKAFEKNYTKSLDKYFEVLASKKGSLSEIQARKRKALLGLARREDKKDIGMPSESVSEITAGDADKSFFKPLLVMNPGYIELLKNDNVFTGKVSYALTCSSSVFKDLAFFQNSRQITCVRGDKALWSRQFDNSIIATNSNRENVRENTPIFTGSFSPKSNGQVVLARLVSDGNFGVYALDCNDGHTVWEMNKKGYSICSDPVIYQDQILALAKKPDVITQYFLIVMNAATGSIEDEIYLFSGDEITPLEGLREILVVRLDIFMPEPAIINGRAYISTNSGILFCVDLEGDFIVWARKYPRVPFIAKNMDLSYVLGKRRNIVPVAGTKNVLFAPVDASGLMLLDKNSGIIAAENSTIRPLDIRQTGPDSFLVIDKNSAAGLYSLNGFEPVKALT
ncbi:MAG: hypothetical protein WCP55_19495, partial [Lentisphaerota bacterium]